MLTTDRIVIATLNSEKFAVFQQLFRSNPAYVLTRADSAIRNPEKLKFVVDWKRPCLENAIAKARFLGQARHSPILSESACIELGEGEDRVIIPDDDLDLCYSIGLKGSPLKQVTSLLNGSPMQAVLDSAVAFLVEGIMITDVQRIAGTVIPEPRGRYGCGFDSIFIPDGENRTLAEMSQEDRERRSPRGRAVLSVLQRRKELGITLVKPQAG